MMPGLALIKIVTFCVPVAPMESVTVMIPELKLPSAVGVPLMTPVEEFMERPVGRLVAEKVRVPVPPLAVTV